MNAREFAKEAIDFLARRRCGYRRLLIGLPYRGQVDLVQCRNASSAQASKSASESIGGPATSVLTLTPQRADPRIRGVPTMGGHC
jgi:hypothetical protein